MPSQTLVKRVETLERKMSALELLPEKVAALEVQFSLLREEMRAEFFAIRGDLGARIDAGDEETRRVLRHEIRAGDEETQRLMRELNDQTTRRMRVLHEDLVSRIALLQEGSRGSNPPVSE